MVTQVDLVIKTQSKWEMDINIHILYYYELIEIFW